MNRLLSPAGVAATYTVAALVLTWPLAADLTGAVPWDMGDPVLNAWILAWGADHLHQFFSGDLRAFAGYWDAGIFHPSPLALAYSEHLFAQAFLIWPVYALTRNPLLCYNIAFLSTFVLSGLGMYLLVRELTGSRGAALIAGLLFAFTPYRLAQSSHLPVLSSQWMPFVFYGFHRYVTTGGVRPLAGGAAALVAQNLSCGYYLVFFAPVAAAWVLFDMLRFGRWPDGRRWLRLTAAAALVAVATWPFVRPYLTLRAVEFPAREISELRLFSADLTGYLAADPRLGLWGGRLGGRAATQEGVVFQGVVPMALAAASLLLLARGARPGRAGGTRQVAWRRRLTLALSAFAALNACAAGVVAAFGPAVYRAGALTLRMTRPGAALVRAGMGLLLAAAAAPPAWRRRAVALAGTDTAFFAVLAASAALLSLGPAIASGGRITVDPAPYAWLYETVPGFDGLRVPARFAMIVAFALSALGGIAASALLTRPGGIVAAAVLAAVFLAEASAIPIVLNGPLPSRAEGVATPRAPLYDNGAIPAIYAEAARLPAGSVLIEFPIGTTAWDVRYMFYSTFHGRRLVNGFSGGVPARYAADFAGITRWRHEPDVAWARLVRTGASHALVHLDAYEDAGGRHVEAWLRDGGAVVTARSGSDLLFALPVR